MGRQVNFYMTEIDERVFLQEIIKNNQIILDEKGKILSLEEAIQPSNYQLWIADKSGDLQFSTGGFINSSFSEAIEYSRCEKVNDYALDHGRIWAEFRYYDDNANIVKKSLEFEKLYQTYAKWLKKNMKLSTNKSFYIGKDAYEQYKKGLKMKSTPVSFTEFE